MTQEEIQKLAQELVDLKIEIKKLQEEQNLIKLDLYENAKNGIQCQGGTVWFVEETIEKRFKQSKLKIALEKEGLDTEKINRIFENSKEENLRSANIYIQLDK